MLDCDCSYFSRPVHRSLVLFQSIVATCHVFTGLLDGAVDIDACLIGAWLVGRLEAADRVALLIFSEQALGT